MNTIHLNSSLLDSKSVKIAYYLAKKKTRHPINKFIYIEKLMKILTMMIHQYLVWAPLPQSPRPSFLVWICKEN